MKKVISVIKNIGLATLYLAYMCLILVMCRHGLNYFYNEYVLSHYEHGDYSINDNLLLTLNYIEPYIVHYNNGNILYKNSLFEEAIEEYNTALTYDIPKKKECKVRVNLALAMVACLPEDYDSADNIDNSIETLKAAQDVLTEKGCATEEGDGHDAKAQKLYDELQEEIDKLEELKEEQEEEQQEDQQDQQEDGEDGEDGDSSGTVDPSQQDDADDSQNPGDEEQEGGSEEGDGEQSFDDFESSIQEQLEDAAQEAYEERVDDLQEYQEESDWWNGDWWDWDDDYEGIW